MLAENSYGKRDNHRNQHMSEDGAYIQVELEWIGLGKREIKKGDV